MEEKDRYIEYKVLSRSWGWVIIILITISLLAFGMWVMMIVPDAPRQWSYGTLPQTPAESAYSTLMPTEAMKPEERVVPKLPEAKPLTPFTPPSDWATEAVKEYLKKHPKGKDQ
jgi:hypothetical protein